MATFKPEKLTDIAAKIFQAAGAPKDKAQTVARLLVSANMTGHDSHGVIRIRQYIEQIRKGVIVPTAEPVIELDAGVFSKVNGNRGFGQVAASFAMKLCIEKAQNLGMAMIGCCDMAHIGRLGDYVSMAAEKDLLALALCNGGGPNVAPYGSRQRVLGTNPIACAVPVPGAKGIQIDFASSATAEGKLNIARSRHEAVRPGLVIDADGDATTDPNDFYQGGAILPIGEHKGSALSLILEIFAGIFTGGRCSAFDGYVDGNGVLFLAMKPDLFRNRQAFDQDIALLQKSVLTSQKAAGIDEILFPGQKETRSLEIRKQMGVELDDAVWRIIQDIAKSLGLDEIQELS